jgi:alkaline phosphatase
MQHATDSANTAGSLATGHKASVNMVSVDLYEEDVSTIVEDAMTCGKSGGVVTSVPILHATPAAFVSHSNNRNSGFQLGKSFENVNPTYASGTCAASGTVPAVSHRTAMLPGGPLSSQWTFLYQGINNSTAENFYDPIQSLDPDDGKHVLACFGGQYTAVAKSEGNMPYRGVDSSYSNRWCSRGSAVRDANNTLIGIVPTTQKCDHYNAAEKAQIPRMVKQVEEAIKFLGKDNQGFFMMYEQGDVSCFSAIEFFHIRPSLTLRFGSPQIDWAAHANHMDDMLGAMLDIDDGVTEILKWIDANGGFAKNALYVTADHDHYLTLNDDFPEIVAKKIIFGETYDLTPQSNSNVNPMDAAVTAGKHLKNLTQVDILNDYTTWNDTDISNVGHFWGARGSGGNGWGSHTTRPVPLFYGGDGGCIDKLTGKGYQVLGREVAGVPGKIDQVHIHACMLKNLFGLV